MQKHFLDLLGATNAEAALKGFSAEQARVLAALFSGSQALGALLVSNPDWVTLFDLENLKFTRRRQGLQSEVSGWLERLLGTADYTSALNRLRQFKQREMLRIAARDLGRMAKNLQFQALVGVAQPKRTDSTSPVGVLAASIDF